MKIYDNGTLDAHYCLLVAIFSDYELDSTEARLLYDYGPKHPLCKSLLKKKLRRTQNDEHNISSGDQMFDLWMQGYSRNEIAKASGCYPSTVDRRMQKVYESECNPST